ncbi:MAG TPA: hypothetical protein PLD02_16725 [Saprospiraceae bacterium]|nr:hypothetical protein [Saprospiraceae bacterium]
MRTTKKLPYPRSDTDGTPLGIDLIPKNLQIIRKTLRAKMRVPHGYTFEDWFQEVLLVLWRRNHQPSAYDPRKANIETYTIIVAKSVSLKSERKYFTKLPQILYIDAGSEGPTVGNAKTDGQYYTADLDLAIDLLHQTEEQE